MKRALIVILVCAGCSSKLQGFSGVSAAAVASPPEGIDIATAPTADCANGGKIYSIYQDLNANGILDDGEAILSKQTVCNGSDGVGAAGPAGHDGSSFQLTVAPASAASCPGGGTLVLMALDKDHTGHYNATDPEQQSLTLCNGVSAPATPYTPVEPLYPCGNVVPYKEVLLRLNNGQVLASFSDNAAGAMTRLSFIPDGTYVDTDDSACVFSLSTVNRVRSISWLGKVQESWAFAP